MPDDPNIGMDPLTEKGKEIMSSMKQQYGSRGEEVFYRSKNAGTITGVDVNRMTEMPDPLSGGAHVAPRNAFVVEEH